MKPKLRASLVLALSVLLVASVVEAKKPKKLKMDIEDGALDEIHLKVESIPSGVVIVLRPFSTDNADLGSGDEDGREKVKQFAAEMKKAAPGVLSAQLKASLEKAGIFAEVREDGEAPADGLVIEGEFLMINPGSRAARYFVGFGAGASGIGVGGTVKNGKGELLAEFKHRRHSGLGIVGGDSVKFMTDDTKDVAVNLADFLVLWAKGGDLSEEYDED